MHVTNYAFANRGDANLFADSVIPATAGIHLAFPKRAIFFVTRASRFRFLPLFDTFYGFPPSRE